MENSDVLELAAMPHPDRRVRQVGFDLTHPYVEQCWGAVIGPSGVAIMRRLPVLWIEREPARVRADDLGRSLGLGAGGGQNSRLQRSLERTVRFGLAEWAEPGRVLGVYTDVPPLRGRRLEQLPEWSRRAHDRLLSAHVDHLVSVGTGNPEVAAVSARLDRLQRPNGPDRTPVPTVGR